MRKILLGTLLGLFITPVFGEEAPPTCDELKAAYDVIGTSDLNQNNYIDIIAQVMFDNKLVILRNLEMTLDNVKTAMRNDTKRDPFKWVMFLYSDLSEALEKNKCQYEKRNLKVW